MYFYGLISTFHLSTSNHESESPSSNVKELHHHPSAKWQWIVFSELREKFSPRSWQRCAHVSFRLFLSSLWQAGRDKLWQELLYRTKTEGKTNVGLPYCTNPLLCGFTISYNLLRSDTFPFCLCKLGLETIFSQRELSASPEPALLLVRQTGPLWREGQSFSSVRARCMICRVVWCLETYGLSWTNSVPSQEKNAWNLQNYVACFRLQC